MSEVRDLFQAHLALPRLLDRRLSVYVVATGAGAGIQESIWRVPGCSSFFRGASFPYDPAESSLFAGIHPDRFVSHEFAMDLACAAYMKAVDLQNPEIEPVGLAVTASVATNREHRGEPRAHISVLTRTRAFALSLTFESGVGAEARFRDGRAVDAAALKLLMEAVESTEERTDFTLDHELVARFFQNPVFWPDGHRDSESCLDRAWPLFPGAFNPPTEGHEAIANTLRGTDRVCEPVFAICLNPPHKPPLSVQEMLRRAKMLRHRVVYFSRNDPLYIDKARQHPGAPLVIGADALLRLVDTKWTTNPTELLEEFLSLDTKLLVFGREVGRRYVTAQEAIARMPLDAKRRTRLFRAIDGRWDVSSTVLRRQDQDHHPNSAGTASDGSDPIRSAAQSPSPG